jgi:hypothetical protein
MKCPFINDQSIWEVVRDRSHSASDIGGVSRLASSAVDCGFELRPGQTKDMKLLFVVSLQSMQDYE